MMTTAPYDPRSGNTPDAKPLDIAGMRYQAQYKPTAPVSTTEYNTERIYDNRGNLVEVYTEGPNAGRGVNNGELVIQGEKPVYNDISGLTSDRSNNGEGVVGYIPKGGSVNNEMQDAYQRLYDEFNAIGLGALVADSKDLLMKATSISAIPDALRNTKAYQTRFSANDARIKSGLKALSPAEYLAKEDAYQNLMRNYGLPASYYTPGQYGKQEGFDKLLANDVSAAELEDRISTAQQRVLNANPEVLNAIKNFYGDSVTNGDILAYALNPSQGLADIKKKVTAAEIQGAANVFGLNKITAESTPEQIKALEARANALAGYGVNKAEAEKGFATVAEIAPRGSELAGIYKQEPYTQQTAEAEVFGTAGAAEAKKKRQKLTALEQAQFSGSSGVSALGRDKAIYGGSQGQAGLY